MRFLVLLCALPVLVVAGCGTLTGSGGPSLDGRTFLSTGLTEEGRPRELVEGTRVSLGFEDGHLRASAGCNTMSGAYRLDGDRLVAEQLATTEMGCSPELMGQDVWLSQLLTSGPVLATDGDGLTLTSGSTVLSLLDRVVADPDRPLVGTTWRVDSLVTGDTVSSTPGGAEASIVFGEDGTVEVMTGCNRGRGTWTGGDGTVTVSGLALTRMACPGDLGQLERAVLEVLDAGALQVRITAASLQLLADDVGLGLRAD